MQFFLIFTIADKKEKRREERERERIRLDILD